jgi:hypothetical protein
LHLPDFETPAHERAQVLPRVLARARARVLALVRVRVRALARARVLVLVLVRVRMQVVSSRGQALQQRVASVCLGTERDSAAFMHVYILCCSSRVRVRLVLTSSPQHVHVRRSPLPHIHPRVLCFFFLTFFHEPIDPLLQRQ